MSKEKPKTKKSIYKPKPISGFPEWLPEERIVEQQWFDHIRKTFESYGFCSIETPSVEELDAITAKGEVDKEIYVLERLQKEEGSKKDARLALHFDQTVPFARYTAQHFNDLVFPFKRYQMQRVWRGERPQMGRMREFYQCDIDVINVDNLPIHFDAEIASVIYETLDGLNIGRVQLRISNRKIIGSIIETYASNDTPNIDILNEKKNKAFAAIDKIEKIGEIEVSKILETECGFQKDRIEHLLNAIKRKIKTKEDLEQLKDLPGLATTQRYLEGIEELGTVLDGLSHLPEHAVIGDLSIVRGLDYYTGTVYETQLLDVPEFTGSVCSGGRYDDLAGGFINKHLPGVGISIGFSRLFDVIRQSRPDLMNIGPKSPTHILVYTEDKDKGALTTETAQILRQRGFNVEVYHTVKKWDKHVNYAKKKVIPYIWYPQEGSHKIKNMETGEEIQTTPETWEQA